MDGRVLMRLDNLARDSFQLESVNNNHETFLAIFKYKLDETLDDNKDITTKTIKQIMGKPYPVISKQTKLEEVSKLISKENDAVLVDLDNGNHHIITKYDIISAI